MVSFRRVSLFFGHFAPPRWRFALNQRVMRTALFSCAVTTREFVAWPSVYFDKLFALSGEKS